MRIRKISCCVALGHCAICDPKVTQKRGPLQTRQAGLQLAGAVSVKALGELGGTRPSSRHEVGIRSIIPGAEVVKIPDAQNACAAISRSTSPYWTRFRNGGGFTERGRPISYRIRSFQGISSPRLTFKSLKWGDQCLVNEEAPCSRNSRYSAG